MIVQAIASVFKVKGFVHYREEMLSKNLQQKETFLEFYDTHIANNIDNMEQGNKLLHYGNVYHWMRRARK